MPSSENTRVRVLTTEYNGIPHVITSPVLLAPAFLPGHTPDTLPHLSLTGIWDTGATNTVITRQAIEALHLKPIGMKRVSTSGGIYDRDAYLISLTLESKAHFPVLEAVEGHILGGDVLIGMNVITQGDFAVTNREGRTVFSFRVPSLIHLDFGRQSS